jgi:hypothetical protein
MELQQKWGEFIYGDPTECCQYPFRLGLQAMSGYFEREDDKYELKQEINTGGLVSFVDYNFREWKT